jgi:hypothetical protein
MKRALPLAAVLALALPAGGTEDYASVGPIGVAPAEESPGALRDAPAAAPTLMDRFLQQGAYASGFRRGYRVKEGSSAKARIGLLRNIDGLEKNPIVVESGMTIDTDGDIADPARAKAVSARDRLRQRHTSMRYRDGAYPDPTQVAYIVLPIGFTEAGLGDFALVRYRGREAMAVCADKGPRGAFGEGSIRLAELLGIPADGRTGGVESGVTYILFPKSGSGRPASQQALQEGMEQARERLATALEPGTMPVED